MPEEPDDQQLLAEFASENSEAAFATLVGRYVNLVYSAALRFAGNPQAAEEISQAVFIILARKAAGLRRGVVLSGWLYQTARLTAANYVKQDIRRQRREQEAYMQSTLNEPGSETWNEIAPLLDEAMGGLGETDRNAVVLRYFENKTSREVAAALKMTEAAAHMRVHRALGKLHKLLTKRGVVSTTAVIAGTVSANSVHAAPVGLASTLSTVALAKGAAASASTLTLVKGGLKLMAWSKTKTVTITAALVFFGAAGTGVVGYNVVQAIRAAYYPSLVGAWVGIMPLGGTGVKKGETTSTRIVVKLSKAWGRYTASFDAVDLGRTNIPIPRIVYDFPNIQIFLYPNRNMVYQGKVNRSGMRIDFSGQILKKTSSPPIYTPLDETDFAPRPGSDLQGYWKGEIRALNNYPTGLGGLQLGNQTGNPKDGSVPLPINLKIAESADGTFRAELDNPMQGEDRHPASMTLTGRTINVVLDDHSSMFRGTMDSSGELSGSWIQDGQSYPVIFKRADYQAELEQRSEENFLPTFSTDLQGHWRGSWDVLLGNVKVKIPMELDIAKLPDGSYSAAMANLEQLGNEAPMPASSFEYTPPNLYAEWKWAGGVYSGRFANGRIVGIWQQGGGGFPLVFERQKN